MNEELKWMKMLTLPIPPEDIQWRGQGKAVAVGEKFRARFVPYISRTIAYERLTMAVGMGLSIEFTQSEPVVTGEDSSTEAQVFGSVRMTTPQGSVFNFSEVGSSSGDDAAKGGISDFVKRVASALGVNQTYRMEGMWVDVKVPDPGNLKRYYPVKEAETQMQREAIRAYNHQRARWERLWGERCPAPILNAAGQPAQTEPEPEPQPAPQPQHQSPPVPQQPVKQAIAPEEVKRAVADLAARSHRVARFSSGLTGALIGTLDKIGDHHDALEFLFGARSSKELSPNQWDALMKAFGFAYDKEASQGVLSPEGRLAYEAALRGYANMVGQGELFIDDSRNTATAVEEDLKVEALKRYFQAFNAAQHAGVRVPVVPSATLRKASIDQINAMADRLEAVLKESKEP